MLRSLRESFGAILHFFQIRRRRTRRRCTARLHDCTSILLCLCVDRFCRVASGTQSNKGPKRSSQARDDRAVASTRPVQTAASRPQPRKNERESLRGGVKVLVRGIYRFDSSEGAIRTTRNRVRLRGLFLPNPGTGGVPVRSSSG